MNRTDVRLNNYFDPYGTETGLENIYKCSCQSPNNYHLRNSLTSAIYFLGDIVCDNTDFFI